MNMGMDLPNTFGRDPDAGLKATVKKGENEQEMRKLAQEFAGRAIDPATVTNMQIIAYLSFMLGDDLDSAELYFQNSLGDQIANLLSTMRRLRLEGKI